MVQEPLKELSVTAVATTHAVPRLRAELRAFLSTLDISESHSHDVIVAVGEAVANAVEHAYKGEGVGDVKLALRLDNRSVLHVEVADAGKFLHRDRLPNRGFGLTLMRTLASSADMYHENGTRIVMTFDIAR